MVETIIAQEPLEIGGHVAISNVSEDYTGVCAILTFNGHLIATAPNLAIASQVASYAITPDGGYCSVCINEAHGSEPTVLSLADWLAIH